MPPASAPEAPLRMEKPMPILVTGGLGFVGINLVRALAAEGETVICADLGTPDAAARRFLAPAGDRECIRAAIENGANAVYFGLATGFNARARATNFSPEELPDVPPPEELPEVPLDCPDVPLLDVELDGSPGPPTHAAVAAALKNTIAAREATRPSSGPTAIVSGTISGVHCGSMPSAWCHTMMKPFCSRTTGFAIFALAGIRLA